MARRVETKTSRTAEITCMIRFQSFMEKRVQYKSDNYITMVIVNSIAKFLFKLPFINNYFLKNIYAVGMYEYVIVRTKLIDSEFKKALNEGMEQVLILGAGFDSRAIRFHDIEKNAVIFLYLYATQ